MKISIIEEENLHIIWIACWITYIKFQERCDVWQYLMSQKNSSLPSLENVLPEKSNGVG